MSGGSSAGGGGVGGGFVESSKPLRRRLSHSVPSRAPCSTIAEVDHTTERSESDNPLYLVTIMLKGQRTDYSHLPVLHTTLRCELCAAQNCVFCGF